MIKVLNFKVLGVRVDAVQLQDAVRIIGSWVSESGPTRYVAVTGMHGVMEAQKDPVLKEILNSADLVVPDGISVLWLGRFRHGLPLKYRVTGTDLMTEICRALGSDLRHFLYGGAPGVAERLSKIMAKQWGVNIVGTYTPPFRPLSPKEDEEVIAKIQQAKPHIIWVGLSTPKQERWMFEHRHRIGVSVMIGVGAVFDFLTGVKPKCPRWLGEIGLEWLFRLLREPSRLWRRSLVLGPKFLWYLTLETLRLREF